MPDTSNYFHQLRTNVGNQTPGFSQVAYITPAAWISAFGAPVGSFGADSKTLDTDHTFVVATPAKGFIKLYALPKSVESNGETNGEPGALNLNWKQKLYMPGDNAYTQAMVEALKNDDVILLLEDAQCPDGVVYKYGYDRTPASIISIKAVSGKKGEGTKGYEIEVESVQRYFYTGTIALMVP